MLSGYWVWQYDLVGFVRLRRSLWALEVSSVYRRRDRFTSRLQHGEHEHAVRVLAADPPHAVYPQFVQVCSITFLLSLFKFKGSREFFDPYIK
jgi:hypothetical protein